MDYTQEKQNIGFITGITGNTALNKLANITIKIAEREYTQYGKPVKRYHSCGYKAGSLVYTKRVVVNVEVSSMGTNVGFIVIA